MLVALLTACTSDSPGHHPPQDPCEVDDAGLTPDGLVCTIAGTGFRGSNGNDLPALESWLDLPSFLTFDPDGRVVVTDYNNLRIRRIDPDGILRTIAGNGGHAYAYDGIQALDSPLENPVATQIAADGTMYIYEQHGARILRVDPTGWLTVYAGSSYAPGYDLYSGDGGPALGAGLSQGSDLALADDGTLYFADSINDVVRKIGPDGIIDTVAGDGEPGLVDGVGLDARFDWPWGLELDGDTLYVTEYHNNSVRAIDLPTRTVTTVAGGFPNPTPGTDLGDGGLAVDAHLFAPEGVSVGPDGALYVSDTYDHAIRRIDPDDGTLETVMGELAVPGDDGDGGPVEDAHLQDPWDVVVSAAGDLYVVDSVNSRVRLVRGFVDGG